VKTSLKSWLQFAVTPEKPPWGVLAWPRRLMAQLQRFIVTAEPTAYPSVW
jgi:hypothetical protein